MQDIEKTLEVDDVPVVMDFVVAQEENVFPMIPAGKSYEELMETQPE